MVHFPTSDFLAENPYLNLEGGFLVEAISTRLAQRGAGDSEEVVVLPSNIFPSTNTSLGEGQGGLSMVRKKPKQVRK